MASPPRSASTRSSRWTSRSRPRWPAIRTAPSARTGTWSRSLGRTRAPSKPAPVALLARITFVVLVGATFAAFFVAQRLKSAPPVISVNLTRYFSPNGDGQRDASGISLVVKKADEATIDVVTLDGDRVRRLAEGVRMRAYRPYRVRWDGKGDDGQRVPDGRYRLRVSLRDEGRS